MYYNTLLTERYFIQCYYLIKLTNRKPDSLDTKVYRPVKLAVKGTSCWKYKLLRLFAKGYILTLCPKSWQIFHEELNSSSSLGQILCEIENWKHFQHIKCKCSSTVMNTWTFIFLLALHRKYRIITSNYFEKKLIYLVHCIRASSRALCEVNNAAAIITTEKMTIRIIFPCGISLNSVIVTSRNISKYGMLTLNISQVNPLKHMLSEGYILKWSIEIFNTGILHQDKVFLISLIKCYQTKEWRI